MAGSGPIATFGSPTSAASGGGSGGFSSAGSNCKENRQPTATSPIFPAAAQRTRTPPMPGQGSGPTEFSPYPPDSRSSAMSRS
jgi:hypothetical protein